MSQSLKRLIQRSRKRFWIYTAGPFLLGIAASGMLWLLQDWSWNSPLPWILTGLMVLYTWYFLFPANLLIYGVNDMADSDTDLRNPKKGTYEQAVEVDARDYLRKKIIIRNTVPHLIGIGLILWAMQYGYIFQREIIPLWILFYITSIFYSLPPIRAKSLPFLDGIFNVLYCLPGLIGYIMLGGTRDSIVWVAFLAGWIWAIAMHTYSAIPDIKADKEAGVKTTAVTLGNTETHFYCLILRVVSALLLAYAIPSLSFFANISGAIYAILIIASLFHKTFTIYKLFPIVNGILGCILFWLIMFV